MRWTLPKAGILRGVYLNISAVVAGTISGSPNALGLASIIKEVRAQINNGNDLFRFSGAGYAYGIRQMIGSYRDPVPGNVMRSAVTAATHNLSIYIPVSVNDRDPVGLFMLQNEGTEVQLSIETESMGSVDSGITSLTVTCEPQLDLFTVPADAKDWPNFGYLCQIIEQSKAIAAAGDDDIYWPRGGTYLWMQHLAGVGVSGSDKWDYAVLQSGQTKNVIDLNVAGADLAYGRTHGTARLAGVIPFDLLGESGFGEYGTGRDVIQSEKLTDLKSTITYNAATTVYTIRRQLIVLK